MLAYLADMSGLSDIARLLHSTLFRPHIRVWIARGDDGAVRMLVTEGVLSKRHLGLLQAIVPSLRAEQHCIDLRAN